MLKRIWKFLFPQWEVIDVDTVRQPNGRALRIIGIDGLEKDQPWGQEAIKRLRQLLKQCGRLSTKITGVSYNRDVGFLYGQGGAEDIGRILVLEGLAFNAPKYGNLYAKEEAEARKHKRGMWETGTEHVNPETWRRRK